MALEKSAGLCWGQRYHWLRYHLVPPGTRHDAHIVVNCPLPDGVSAEDLRGAVNYLVRRHEALRTVYDLAAQPYPQQRVQPPGPVPFVSAATENDGTPTPAEVIRELTTRDFDLAREWPLRPCLVTTGEVPKRLVVVLNHVVFDDWGLETFRREFEEILAASLARRRASLPPVASQPVDLARGEASRPATELTARLDYWRQEIARTPADLFARRRTVPWAPAACSASLVSPSLLAAVREIAGRHHAWPSAVHLAAYAVTMAAYTGEDTASWQWLASHREASQQLSVLTCMFSPLLVTVDLAGDPPFSEVIRRITARVTSAQDHGYVPHDEIVEERAREGARRGQPMRLGVEMNFLNHAGQPCGTRKDRLAWNRSPEAWARSGTDAYFRVYEWQDGVTVALQANAAVMDAGSVERFLRGYTALLHTLSDPARDPRVSELAGELDFPAPERQTMVRAGADLVDTQACEALLLAHPAVISARVSPAESGLTAEVAAGGPLASGAASPNGAATPGSVLTPAAPLTPASLRHHMASRVDAVPATRCPAWFRILDRDGTVTAEGTGRDSGTAPAATEAEQAIAAAVADANRIDVSDLSASYCEAGGRVLRMPLVEALLAERGWHGITASDLTGVSPLAALAARLTRTAAPDGRPPLSSGNASRDTGRAEAGSAL